MIGLIAALASIPAFMLYQEVRKAQSEDPRVYWDDIAKLTTATRERGKSDGTVLFTGSSSIRMWSTLEQDMQPLVTVQHGFGGAKLADLEHYAEQLVNAFAPRAVVVFAGTNDLHPGNSKPPEILLDTYRRFVDRVRKDLPSVPIYYIGITPSPRRWEIWDLAQKTNRMIREYCDANAWLHYIETGPALLGTDGTPNPENYKFDGLHLSSEGYSISTQIIQARLMNDLGVRSSPSML